MLCIFAITHICDTRTGFDVGIVAFFTNYYTGKDHAFYSVTLITQGISLTRTGFNVDIVAFLTNY